MLGSGLVSVRQVIPGRLCGRAIAGPALVATIFWLLVSGAGQARGEDYGARVRVLDNVFSPEVVRVEPGANVEWANDGRTVHDVRADDGSWRSPILQPGETVERTFTEPGVYAFFCSFHGSPGAGMIGTVLVGDVELPGASSGVGPGREPVPAGFAPTVRVPQDAPSIQAAVDQVEPGGMVLIDRGVYEESVRVTTPFVTIRGVDRNETILDGGTTLANGIHVIEADGVAVENLTARHYVLNGFYWAGVFGYRGSYLTATGNGDYGIYAFGSRYGRFEHSYANGSPDSGFYIGGCHPCDAVVTDVLSEGNALGFSGTNAGGNLLIVNSEFRGNLSGIVPNTLDSEPEAPQRDALIAGNHVHDNAALDVPTNPLQYPSFGNGIIVNGGIDNRVTGNLVEDQPAYGIVLLPSPDRSFWPTSGNQVTDNVVRRSGVADLGLSAPSAGGDCFAGNLAPTSSPPAIELLFPCEGFRPFPGGGGSMAPAVVAGARFLQALDGEVPTADWRRAPPPPPLPSMADPVGAPPQPAIPGELVPGRVTIRTTEELLRAAEDDPGPTVRQEVTLMGTPLAASGLSLLVGLYGYVLPFVLYAAWVAIALWDLIRRDDVPMSHRTRWMLVVLVVPFVGPLLYFGFGRSPIPRQLRLMLTAGGAAVYLLFLLAGVLLGG
jgi:plastocyanin